MYLVASVSTRELVFMESVDEGYTNETDLVNLMWVDGKSPQYSIPFIREQIDLYLERIGGVNGLTLREKATYDSDGFKEKYTDQE